jgi:hypothetical protein
MDSVVAGMSESSKRIAARAFCEDRRGDTGTRTDDTPLQREV